MHRHRGPAMRRYTRSVLMLMMAYALILFGVNAYFDNGPPRGILAYAAAVLPALPIIAVFVVIARLLVELKDEYIRMLIVRQTLVATGFMLSIATIWVLYKASDCCRMWRPIGQRCFGSAASASADA